MENCPRLLPVPCYLRELTLKADLNGVTILKDGRYRKRYVGSKTYQVDINGKLRTAAELRRETTEDVPAWAKKKKGPRQGPPKLIMQKLNKDNPNEVTLSLAEPGPRYYSINKPEIRARLFTMIASQAPDRRELYFWTVTFPLKTDDATIYRLFNIWLTRLRREGLLKNYLWVAERQGNGTLHFHLAITHKMPVKKANGYMRAALVTASKRGEIPFNVWQCKRYNGVDISKNRKERRVTNFAQGKRGRRALISYITKYITKNEGKFTFLAWHNSRGFSQLFTGVTFTLEEFCNVYALAKFVRRHSAIKTEFFQFHPWVNGPPPALENELLKLNSFIQNLN